MRRLIAPLLFLAAAPAAAETYARTFDIYVGGIHGAELDFTAEWQEGGRFAGRSELRTYGIVDAFWSGFYRVSAEGRLEGDRFLPDRFEADSAFGGDRQRVAVEFEAGRPTVTLAEPPFKPRPWQIVPEEQAGTLDPFAAALALLRPGPAEAVCNRSVEIFDGRRRSRISLGAPEAGKDGIRCPATYERVAGFSPKQMRRQASFPFNAVFRTGEDGIAEVWELWGDTGFGVAVVRRRG
jgi:hypothetical protein